jgi:hypothetical protein
MTVHRLIRYTEVTGQDITDEALNIGQFANHVLYEGNFRHHVITGFVATGKSYLMNFIAAQALTSGSHPRIAMVCGMTDFLTYASMRVQQIMDACGLYGARPTFNRKYYTLSWKDNEIQFFRRPYVPVYEEQRYYEYHDLLDPSVVAFRLPLERKIIGYRIHDSFTGYSKDLVLIDDAMLHCYYISAMQYGIDHHEVGLTNVAGLLSDYPARGVYDVGFKLTRGGINSRVVYATDNPFLYHGLEELAIPDDIRGYALGPFTHNTKIPEELAMQLGVIYNARAN